MSPSLDKANWLFRIVSFEMPVNILSEFLEFSTKVTLRPGSSIRFTCPIYVIPTVKNDLV